MQQEAQQKNNGSAHSAAAGQRWTIGQTVRSLPAVPVLQKGPMHWKGEPHRQEGNAEPQASVRQDRADTGREAVRAFAYSAAAVQRQPDSTNFPAGLTASLDEHSAFRLADAKPQSTGRTAAQPTMSDTGPAGPQPAAQRRKQIAAVAVPMANVTAGSAGFSDVSSASDSGERSAVPGGSFNVTQLAKIPITLSHKSESWGNQWDVEVDDLVYDVKRNLRQKDGTWYVFIEDDPLLALDILNAIDSAITESEALELTPKEVKMLEAAKNLLATRLGLSVGEDVSTKQESGNKRKRFKEEKKDSVSTALSDEYAEIDEEQTGLEERERPEEKPKSKNFKRRKIVANGKPGSAFGPFVSPLRTGGADPSEGKGTALTNGKSAPRKRKKMDSEESKKTDASSATEKKKSGGGSPLKRTKYTGPRSKTEKEKSGGKTPQKRTESTPSKKRGRSGGASHSSSKAVKITNLVETPFELEKDRKYGHNSSNTRVYLTDAPAELLNLYGESGKLIHEKDFGSRGKVHGEEADMRYVDFADTIMDLLGKLKRDPENKENNRSLLLKAIEVLNEWLVIIHDFLLRVRNEWAAAKVAGNSGKKSRKTKQEYEKKVENSAPEIRKCQQTVAVLDNLLKAIEQESDPEELQKLVDKAYGYFEITYGLGAVNKEHPGTMFGGPVEVNHIKMSARTIGEKKDSKTDEEETVYRLFDHDKFAEEDIDENAWYPHVQEGRAPIYKKVYARTSEIRAGISSAYNKKEFGVSYFAKSLLEVVNSILENDYKMEVSTENAARFLKATGIGGRNAEELQKIANSDSVSDDDFSDYFDDTDSDGEESRKRFIPRKTGTIAEFAKTLPYFNAAPVLEKAINEIILLREYQLSQATKPRDTRLMSRTQERREKETATIFSNVPEHKFKIAKKMATQLTNVDSMIEDCERAKTSKQKEAAVERTFHKKTDAAKRLKSRWEGSKGKKKSAKLPTHSEWLGLLKECKAGYKRYTFEEFYSENKATGGDYHYDEKHKFKFEGRVPEDPKEEKKDSSSMEM